MGELQIQLLNLAAMRIWDQYTKNNCAKMCVGSFITWCNPYCDVTFSNAFPWEVVLSLQYQNLDFALKSPITTRRKGFLRDNFSKFNSKLSINVSKLSCDWLGDLYRATKVQSLSPIFNSKFTHSLRCWMSKTLKGKQVL